MQPFQAVLPQGLRETARKNGWSAFKKSCAAGGKDTDLEDGSAAPTATCSFFRDASGTSRSATTSRTGPGRSRVGVRHRPDESSIRSDSGRPVHEGDPCARARGRTRVAIEAWKNRGRDPAGADRAPREGQLLAGGRKPAPCAAPARRSSTTGRHGTRLVDSEECRPGCRVRTATWSLTTSSSMQVRPEARHNARARLPGGERRHTGIGGLARGTCVIQGCLASGYSTRDGVPAEFMDWVAVESRGPRTARTPISTERRIEWLRRPRPSDVILDLPTASRLRTEGRGYYPAAGSSVAAVQHGPAHSGSTRRLSRLPGVVHRANGRCVSGAARARRRDRTRVVRPRRRALPARPLARGTEGVRRALPATTPFSGDEAFVSRQRTYGFPSRVDSRRLGRGGRGQPVRRRRVSAS